MGKVPVSGQCRRLALKHAPYAKLLAAIMLVASEIIVAAYSPSKAYPACDNSAAQREMTMLYDNKRLLHADQVSDLRLLDDTLFARHCSAKVKWADGSESEVRYEFDRSGRGNRHLRMWTNYNGGMRGPSFF